MPHRPNHLKRSRSAGLALALLPLVFVIGCEQSKLKKVAVAVDGFSATARAFQEAEIVAHQQGLVDDLEHRQMEQALVDVAHAGLELDNIVRASEPKSWGDARPKALTVLSHAETSLENLLANGVLRVKNPRARQELGALLLSAKGFLATISAVLQ